VSRPAAEVSAPSRKRNSTPSRCMLHILEDLTADWCPLDARIEDLSSEIKAFSSTANYSVPGHRLEAGPGARIWAKT
jgi:hypothetical protein